MIERKSRVRVESKLTAVSSTPIGEPNKVHKLGALDQAMGLHTVHMVFYYQVNPFEEGPMKEYLDNLRVTLSEHLCKYPTMTGRLGTDDEGKWEVKCNDAGVRVVRASVGVTVDAWLSSADASEELHLTLWENMPQHPTFWSPFQIQLNDFEGGGLAIGLSFTHMLADPTSAMLFFSSWADFHRGLPTVHRPIFDFSSLNCPTNNPTPKTSEYTKCIETGTTQSTKMSTITFRFSSANITKCLSQIHSICPDATAFDILVALFWSRIARLTTRPTPLTICLDMRNHKSKPIPFHYFGNALCFSSLSFEAEEALHESDDELGHVTTLVHKHVKGLQEDNRLDWFQSENGEKGKHGPPYTMYGSELTCVSLEHYMSSEDGINEYWLMYGAMFKEGERPIHVSCHIGNVGVKGLILVMPSPGDMLGRTVSVTLPQEQIDFLSQDHAISQLIQ